MDGDDIFCILVFGGLVALFIGVPVCMIFGASIEQTLFVSDWEGRAFITQKTSHEGSSQYENGYKLDIKLINGHLGTGVLVPKEVFDSVMTGDQVNVSCKKGIYGLYDVRVRT